MTLTTVNPQMLDNGPAFSAYKNSGSQSITSSTFTKVTFDAELFDTNSCFASSTFTPTVAGYYQVNAGISISGSGSASRIILMVYKNGSPAFPVQDLIITNYRFSGSCLVQCNGSTDNIEIYAFITGSSIVLESGLGGTGYNTWFQAAMIRAA